MHLIILVLHNESEYNYFAINLDEVGEPIEYEEVELVDTCIFYTVPCFKYFFIFENGFSISKFKATTAKIAPN